MLPNYTYPVVSADRVSAGAFWLTVDVGFRQKMQIHVKLAGVDTPDRFQGSEKERVEGKRAKELVDDWFKLHANVLVQTVKDPEEYGRWLGVVWCNGEGCDHDSDHNLAVDLLTSELAVALPDKWRDVYDLS